MGKCRKNCPGCLVGTFAYLLVLLFLLFLIIFVIVPVIFMYSTEIQRSIIFPTWIAEKVNFSDIESFGLKGVRNFYVNVSGQDNEKENVSLGVWQILPEELVKEFVSNDHYNYDGVLANEKYDIILYLHGNGAIRSASLELYEILRKSFHIFAADYRGYGDSSKATLTEEGIVSDIVDLFKWLRQRTKTRIFFWGHSLGTGVSTHAISNLRAQDMVPSGLVLETPFTSVVEVMERHPFIKLYSWLPWYRATLLDPMVDNGFGFESSKYILDVDCPIMILHAKDDTVIPYDIAAKLYDIGSIHRNTSFQGNVTFHLFEALGYDHMSLFLAPELPDLIRKFQKECIEFKAFRKNVTDIGPLKASTTGEQVD